MGRIGDSFNRLADKIVNAKLVTRKGVQEVSTSGIPGYKEYKRVTLHQWYEARKTEEDEYRIFQVQQKLTHTFDGVTGSNPDTVPQVNAKTRNKFRKDTHIFTRAEAVEFLKTSENAMLRNTLLTVGKKPSSVGMFKRYYK